MTDTLVSLPSKDQFREHLESAFRVGSGDDVVEMKLIQVNDGISNNVQHSFTLVFVAPPETVPEQGLYHFEHSSLGGMELFVVPVKRDETGLHFEAVFNHLVG